MCIAMNKDNCVPSPVPTCQSSLLKEVASFPLIILY